MKWFTFAVLVVCTFSLAFCVTPEEGHAKVKQAGKKCQENPDTAAPREEIDAAKKGGVPTDKVKTHLLCISKTLGWQNDDGTVNKDVVKDRILTYLNLEKYETIKDECNVDKATPIETAVNLFACFAKYFKS